MHSLMEVNASLRDVVSRLQHRVHSRFEASLLKGFNALAKEHLQPLPAQRFEQVEWKNLKIRVE